MTVFLVNDYWYFLNFGLRICFIFFPLNLLPRLQHFLKSDQFTSLTFLFYYKYFLLVFPADIQGWGLTAHILASPFSCSGLYYGGSWSHCGIAHPPTKALLANKRHPQEKGGWVQGKSMGFPSSFASTGIIYVGISAFSAAPAPTGHCGASFLCAPTPGCHKMSSSLCLFSLRVGATSCYSKSLSWPHCLHPL